MQAVVDFRYLFLDVYIGWPGKVHDARVLVNSTAYQKATSGTLLPNWTTRMGGVNVPLVLLGDPAYPLLPWLMKPYVESPSTPSQERLFNYRLSRARMVVENAFGRLKGRWRCLMKRLDLKTSHVPSVAASCVVLDNMCEIYGDHCLEGWFNESSSPVPSFNAGTNSNTSTTSNSTAVAIRDAL